VLGFRLRGEIPAKACHFSPSTLGFLGVTAIPCHGATT
jgi:hypothetical protein